MLLSSFKIRFFFWFVLLVLSVWRLNFAWAGNWDAHVSMAQALSTQLNNMEIQIKELAKEKKHTRDPARLQEILQQMQAKHKEMKPKFTEYEKLRQHMQFQHPERGDDSERRYLLFQLKSVEEIEAEVGLDGQLDRLRRKVHTVYRADLPPPPPPKESPVPHTQIEEGRPVLRK